MNSLPVQFGFRRYHFDPKLHQRVLSSVTKADNVSPNDEVSQVIFEHQINSRQFALQHKDPAIEERAHSCFVEGLAQSGLVCKKTDTPTDFDEFIITESDAPEHAKLKDLIAPSAPKKEGGSIWDRTRPDFKDGD